jgi:hypothetical protein
LCSFCSPSERSDTDVAYLTSLLQALRLPALALADPSPDQYRDCARHLTCAHQPAGEMGV